MYLRDRNRILYADSGQLYKELPSVNKAKRLSRILQGALTETSEGWISDPRQLGRGTVRRK